MVTLSVSSSTSGSSTATASPDRLNHLPTVASVTDSPRVGTRISVMKVFLIEVVSRTQSPVFHDGVGGQQVERILRVGNAEGHIALVQRFFEKRLKL